MVQRLLAAHLGATASSCFLSGGAAGQRRFRQVTGCSNVHLPFTKSHGYHLARGGVALLQTDSAFLAVSRQLRAMYVLIHSEPCKRSFRYWNGVCRQSDSQLFSCFYIVLLCLVSDLVPIGAIGGRG